MENNSDPFEDKWSNTPTNELMRQRPLGVSILAFLQIIGALAMLVLIFTLPGLFNEANLNELIGYPLLEILIIYAIITIPISIILANGLLNGEKWAKKITIFYQLSSIITAIISLNICGIIIPIIVLLYLVGDQKVKDFFTKDAKYGKTFKNIITICAIIVIIFNIAISISLVNFRIDLQNEANKPDMTNAEFEEMLIGNWTGESMFFDEEIELDINSDYTCIARYSGITYAGTWRDISEKHYNSIEFSWSEALKVPSMWSQFEDSPDFDFNKYSSITSGDCHNPGTFTTQGSVIFTKNK